MYIGTLGIRCEAIVKLLRTWAAPPRNQKTVVTNWLTDTHEFTRTDRQTQYMDKPDRVGV